MGGKNGDRQLLEVVSTTAGLRVSRSVGRGGSMFLKKKGSQRWSYISCKGISIRKDSSFDKYIYFKGF